MWRWGRIGRIEWVRVDQMGGRAWIKKAEPRGVCVELGFADGPVPMFWKPMGHRHKAGQNIRRISSDPRSRTQKVSPQ